MFTKKNYCISKNLFAIIITTIMVFSSGNGWLGSPRVVGNTNGWVGTKKFPTFNWGMPLRSYAVTHTLLYVQLHPIFENNNQGKFLNLKCFVDLIFFWFFLVKSIRPLVSPPPHPISLWHILTCQQNSNTKKQSIKMWRRVGNTRI